MEQDTFAFIGELQHNTNPIAVLQSYADKMHHLFWREKNLTLALALSRAGIQYALTIAAAQPENAPAVLRLAMVLAYDAASFAWVGWNNPDITYDRSTHFLGIDSAKTQLRLALELQCDPITLARAYWMYGAYALAQEDYAVAHRNFDLSHASALRGGNLEEGTMARAYLLLVAVLENPKSPTLRHRLDIEKMQLQNLTNGEVFLAQLESTEKVFMRQSAENELTLLTIHNPFQQKLAISI